jgi:hypothetical protein
LARFREFYFTNSPGVGYRRVGEGASYSYSRQEHIKYLKEVFRKNVHLIDKSDRSQVKSLFYSFIRNKKEGEYTRLKKALRKQLKELRINSAIGTLYRLFRLKAL